MTSLHHRLFGLLRGLGGTSNDGFDRRLILPMILGTILNPINSSIIAVSLIPIGRAFGAPPSQTAWLVAGLYLATSIGQPVVGRLVDLYGPRRLYLAGTAFTGIAGVLGVLAPNLGVLVAARVILGFGTCAGYPAAMYLIRSEGRRTGRDSPAGILTVLAVSTQTIAVVGPSLGGLLIGLGGWRATFAINIPLALACLVFGARWLPRTASVSTNGAARLAGGLDVAGIVLFAVMLSSLLVFLLDPRPDTWYLLVIAALVAAGFTIRERRVANPFIDLRVLAGNRPLVTTYVRQLLGAVVSYLFLYGYTQWLEDGRGLSASVAGLVLLPVFATGIIVSTATGRRPEIRGKLLVGSAAQIVVCAMLLFVRSGSALWLLLAIAVIFGLPQGLNNLAIQNAMYAQADPNRIGSSAGLLRTFLYLGAIIASAVTGAALDQGADTAGLHHLSVAMLVAAGLLFLVTVLDRSLGRVGRPAATGPASLNGAGTETATGPFRAAK